MKRLFKIRWILYGWCWLCFKLDRCDWCFYKVTHSANDPTWEWCDNCGWGPEYPSRWDA